MSAASCMDCVLQRSSTTCGLCRVSSHATIPATATTSRSNHHSPVSPSFVVDAGVVTGETALVVVSAGAVVVDFGLVVVVDGFALVVVVG